MPRTNEPDPKPIDPLGQKVQPEKKSKGDGAVHVRGKIWRLPDGRLETRDYFSEDACKDR